MKKVMIGIAIGVTGALAIGALGRIKKQQEKEFEEAWDNTEKEIQEAKERIVERRADFNKEWIESVEKISSNLNDADEVSKEVEETLNENSEELDKLLRME